MGTSASSKGPGAGVPMVPPWVPDVPLPPEDVGSNDTPATQPPNRPELQISRPQSPTAPAGRFVGARRSFGSFAKTGNQGDLRRGLGHYVSRGYGGSETAVRRFGGTASTANALYGALSTSPGTAVGTPGREFDPALFAGRSAREIMDAVVESVRPVDGTQDAEANRSAIKDALSDLLETYPEADLLNLSEDEKSLAIERFLAIDLYQRLSLDVGKTIQEKAPTISEALARLKEIRDYIRQSVAASFRKLRLAGQSLTAGRVKSFVGAALRDTFMVFEGYTR